MKIVHRIGRHSAVIAMCAATVTCKPENGVVRIENREFDELFELIGSVELPASEEATVGRVAGMAIWGDHVAIVDPHAANVKVFSRQGDLVSVLGRAGEGPGEFRNPVAAVAIDVANLAVLDRTRRTLAIFDAGGGVVDEIDFNHLGAFGDVSQWGSHFFVGVMRSDLGPSAFLLDSRSWLAVDSFAPRPRPANRAEAAFQTAIVGTDAETLLWGFQSRPILYRQRADDSQPDSVFLGTELGTPWSEAPVGLAGLEDWTGRNWRALRTILPLRDGEVVIRFIAGSRRRGTDSQTYVVLDPDWRRAEVATVPAGPEFWTSRGDTLYSVRVSPETGTSLLEMFVRR